MNRRKTDTHDAQFKALSRNDWGNILTLLEKKSYQRKFQIIEAFIELVADRGFHQVTHADLAKKCKISRQLVDHHFPDETNLISLCYRYVYARFQKAGSDAILSKKGFSSQFQSYVNAVADWAIERRNDARFLVQFYALLHTHPEFADLHERNSRIGRERILSLCLQAQEQGFFTGLSKETIFVRASSVQKQMMGFVIVHFAKTDTPSLNDIKHELFRSCLQILNG